MTTKIPKKIHYVWGYNESKPKAVLMCLASWKAFMPDYEFLEWNENTLDFNKLSEECLFFKKSRKINLWAYLADYIRFKVLQIHGGIYLDTDVQVFKNMDNLLNHRFFAGFHHGFKDGLATDEFVEGAVMGAEPNHPFVGDMIDFFQNKIFLHKTTFLPYAINLILQKNYGLPPHPPNKNTLLRKGIKLFSTPYFHPPVRADHTLTDISTSITPETYTIHWNSNSYAGNLKFTLFMNYCDTVFSKKAVNLIFSHYLIKIMRQLSKIKKWFKKSVK